MSNKYSTAQMKELDAKHHLHPFSNHKSLRAAGSRVIVGGEGAHFIDSEGKRVLDGMSGLWTTNIGYGREELAKAAYDQIVELPYYNTFFQTTHRASWSFRRSFRKSLLRTSSKFSMGRRF